MGGIDFEEKNLWMYLRIAMLMYCWMWNGYNETVG